MSELKITTNYHEREVLNYFELTKKQQDSVNKEYDYYSQEEREELSFFIYKNEVYSLSDFMRIGNNSPFNEYWHGYLSQCAFWGLLIHLSECGDSVVIGSYIS